jgi:hypothetical protein
MLVSWTLANLASVLFCRTLSFVFLGVHLIGNSCVVSFLCLTQVLDIRVTWRFVLFAVPRVRVLLGSHTYGAKSVPFCVLMCAQLLQRNTHVISFFAESATLMKIHKTQPHSFLIFSSLLPDNRTVTLLY